MKYKTRRIVLAFSVFCGLCLPLIGMGVGMGMGSRPPLIGGPAPAFTLNDLEGHPVSLSDYHGKTVLLTFWATWCKPCAKEMPEIQAAYEKYEDRNFVVLAINFGEKSDPAKAFTHHGHLTFPVLLDPGAKVASRYSVVSLPVSFFIDANGLIRERVVGGTLTETGIREALVRLQGKVKIP